MYRGWRSTMSERGSEKKIKTQGMIEHLRENWRTPPLPSRCFKLRFRTPLDHVNHFKSKHIYRRPESVDLILSWKMLHPHALQTSTQWCHLILYTSPTQTLIVSRLIQQAFPSVYLGISEGSNGRVGADTARPFTECVFSSWTSTCRSLWWSRCHRAQSRYILDFFAACLLLHTMCVKERFCTACVCICMWRADSPPFPLQHCIPVRLISHPPRVKTE
jgi:hypothetical protein